MTETILNIYLIIENNNVVAFKAISYDIEGNDEYKIKFLKQNAINDFTKAYYFEAPRNRKGEFMSYRKFSKLESQGMQFQLFEEIFERFNVPQNPLICVTPVVDGKILAQLD
ncbi:hypothetical protein [Rosettibacter firmus]|uniref:hypothetical protein n=1 Tax=Rosettibacter firmus TaxID=3111522 RepID=UPI00336BF5CF